MLRKLNWILVAQIGIDLQKIVHSLKAMPRYFYDLIFFLSKHKGRIQLLPCLHDRHEEGGFTKNEYFTQDLYIARKIHAFNHGKHVDVGSRIDGFVAHVASFREIEVLDIREITSDIPGIVFKQEDLMNPSESFVDYCDSLSCLHALEHFGLGRYGDPINPFGHVVGLRNMSKMLRHDGLFYLSVPIGMERVEFNAHRILNPKNIVSLARENNLLLKEFAWVQSNGTLVESINPEMDFEALCCTRYALGIFTFIKN